mmetsp:Transcript_2235/g.6640  ORF Transcript_2235/g.6640 Transcript_2235/m.6640 type:complete len:223 (+) Transcript_2235:148-816(+)
MAFHTLGRLRLGGVEGRAMRPGATNVVVYVPAALSAPARHASPAVPRACLTPPACKMAAASPLVVAPRVVRGTRLGGFLAGGAHHVHDAGVFHLLHIRDAQVVAIHSALAVYRVHTLAEGARLLALLGARRLARGEGESVARLNLSDGALDLAHQERIAVGVEGRGATSCAATTGTADAVHVVLTAVGQRHVDHVRQALHVDAARRHVGGNQEAHAALLEGV